MCLHVQAAELPHQAPELSGRARCGQLRLPGSEQGVASAPGPCAKGGGGHMQRQKTCCTGSMAWLGLKETARSTLCVLSRG